VLLASVNAVAVTKNRRSPSVLFTESADDSINDCGDSSFVDASSSGSPLVSDCLQIAANIAGGGTWEVDSLPIQHQLVQYGTCAFGVTANGDNFLNSYWYYVGNQDIIDLIHSSIDLFQWYGLVGASGYMNCQPDTDVTWGLYHT